jgi:hypothetical protein
MLLGTLENCPHTNFVEATGSQVSYSAAPISAIDYVDAKTFQCWHVTIICVATCETIFSNLNLKEVNVCMVTYLTWHVP